MSRLALLLAALVASTAPAPDHAEQVRYLMGTLWTLEADGPGAPAAVEAAIAELHRLDRAFSTYRPESELSRLNREAATRWVNVSPEVAGLVGRSLDWARASDGAFDPTVGPLVAAWGFKYLDYHVPSAEALAAARAVTGWRHVERRGEAFHFDRPGVSLDLGGIAKGYAVDRALAGLKAAGMSRARVDAGGNQGVFGDGPWRFAVKHPREEGAWLGVVGLTTGAVSTSGDAERGFWSDGIRYGHILDPHTGRPVAGRLSVTVVAPTGEASDALSTALYVLGPERGEALARAHGAVALFVEAALGPVGHRVEVMPGLDWEPAAGPPHPP